MASSATVPILGPPCPGHLKPGFRWVSQRISRSMFQQGSLDLLGAWAIETERFDDGR